MTVNADENYKKIIIRDYIVFFPFVLRFFSSNSKDANVLKSLNYYVGFFFIFFLVDLLKYRNGIP